MNNVQSETSREGGQVKDKNNEFQTNNRNNNIIDLYRDINEFEVYQPTTDLVKGENGDLLADSHYILNGWRKYFCQLLNVQGVNYVIKTEIYVT